MITAVIPTLNEEELLPGLLADLSELGRATEVDVVVADGGSSDGTVALAASWEARILLAPPGRARQLNAGAQAARGDWLLFIHADCRLDAAARRALLEAIAPQSGIQAAVFRFAIDLPPFWKQMIEWGQRIREAVLDLPYGDQGLLVRRRLFEQAGGYPDVPLLEDVALLRRVRRHAAIHRLPAAALTSGRRYRRGGILKTSLQHVVLITLYLAGVSPHRLARRRHA